MTPPNQAIEEIKAVLKKHDLAGIIMVQGPKELAFLRELSPTWSCCTVEENELQGDYVRIKAKRADFPTEEAHREYLANTVSMVLSFMNETERVLGHMTQLAAVIGQNIDFNYFEEAPKRPGR